MIVLINDKFFIFFKVITFLIYEISLIVAWRVGLDLLLPTFFKPFAENIRICLGLRQSDIIIF